MQVNIPLEDFKLKRTNEALFKGNEEMLNVWQLDSVVDSTSHILARRAMSLKNQSEKMFYTRTASYINLITGFKIKNITNFYDSLSPEFYKQAIENALAITRNAASNVEAMNINMETEKDEIIRYLIEWHQKIVICWNE